MARKLDQHDLQANLARVTKWMKRMGMDILGQGFFSRVFPHPKDPTKVIKWGPLSDGWLVYAAWAEAQRGTSNPHLPVIHSIRRYEQHGIYCAVLERLDMTICQAKRKAAEAQDYKGADAWLSWHSVETYLRHGRDHVFTSDWQRLMSTGAFSPVFERTLERLRSFAMKHGLGRDLHDDNAMLRRRLDGGFDVVITDPFSFTHGKAQEALADAPVAAVAA